MLFEAIVAFTFIGFCCSLTIRPVPYLFVASIIVMCMETYMFGFKTLSVGVAIGIVISISIAILGYNTDNKNQTELPKE